MIEFVLRCRVLAIDNIRLRSHCRLTSVVSVDGAVQGVRLDPGSRVLETLNAELVVDASGRARPTLELLDELDCERPLVSEVGVDITYSTVVVNIPPHAMPDAKIVRAFPNSPVSALTAALLPLEGGNWTSVIAAPVGILRPNNWDMFLDTLGRLITPTIFEVLRQTEAPKWIDHFGFLTSLWRHFEGWPACLAAFCLSAMRSAASIRRTTSACPLPRKKRDCCRTCWRA